MPRSAAPSITFQPSSEELEILTEYCQQEDRTRTDVLRQLLRELKFKIKKPASPPCSPEFNSGEAATLT